MRRKTEGQVRFPGPSRNHQSGTDPYQQGGDKGFKSPMAPPAGVTKPVGIRDSIPSSRDSYTGIPGDGITPG